MKLRLFVLAWLLLPSFSVLAEDPSGACTASRDLQDWLKTTEKGVDGDLNSFIRSRVQKDLVPRIVDLCSSQPSYKTLQSSTDWSWLAEADDIGVDLAILQVDALDAPLMAGGRRLLQTLNLVSYRYQVGVGRLRAQAYRAVRTEVKEVQIAAPPVQRNPCEDALRQGARRWAEHMHRWTLEQSGYRGDWNLDLATQSQDDLNRLAQGTGDPTPYLMGWLAQWRDGNRQKKLAYVGGSPLLAIAADMRSQLNYCGMAVDN